MFHTINRQKCVFCAACEMECPVGAVIQDESGDFYCIDSQICTDCGDCLDVCPTEAISRMDEPKGLEKAS